MIYMILAIGLHGEIGDGTKLYGLPWNTIKPDLKHYAETTKKVVDVVMGRHTFEIIKRATNGKMLPGREISVVSQTMSSADYSRLYRTPEDTVKAFEGKDFIVSGGKETYLSFLPYVDEVIVTKVHGIFPNADCTMPANFLAGFVEDTTRTILLQEENETQIEATLQYFVKK